MEQEIEQEIGTGKNIIGKNAEVVKTEEYVEVSVTYEVIENIGMQEKIEEFDTQEENIN